MIMLRSTTDYDPVSLLVCLFVLSLFRCFRSFDRWLVVFYLSRRVKQVGRYSTFQYPDQDPYQDPFPEDFNADALFYVSVSVKRIFLFLSYF